MRYSGRRAATHFGSTAARPRGFIALTSGAGYRCDSSTMEGMADSESATANTAGLQNPSAEELRELLETVTLRVPGVSDWLDVQRASRSEDPAELLAIVRIR